MAIRGKYSFNPGDEDSLSALRYKLGKMPIKNYKVFVCDERPVRSLQQNSYYWAVVIPIMADELGYTKDEMHEVFKAKFLPRHRLNIDGEVLNYSTSTRTLNTKQFEEYIQEIVALAQEMNVYIPEPGEVPDEVVVKQY